MDTRTETSLLQTASKPRRRLRMKTWIATACGIAALGVLGWLLFAPNPIPVELAAVTQGPLRVSVDNQGQVRVHEKYVVAAPVAAELERVDMRDGDPVKRNQPVATLSPLPLDTRQRQEAVARLDAARALAREAALHVDRTRSDMQFAANERARVERLVSSNFVSPQAVEKAVTTEKTSRAEWDAARSRHQAALADVRAAEAALIASEQAGAGHKRQLQLVSPVDGYVLRVLEKSARTVAAGTPLLSIADPARYEIVVDVLSADAVKIRPGNPVLLEGWGGGKVLRAQVRLVEPVAFTKVSPLGVEEQRVNVIADPVDQLGPLGDSYRVEARVVIWSEDKVLKLAASSLFRVGDAWHVFVVENGRAREREVKVGQRNQDEAQILSGLNAGANVVRYPGNQIADGARVAASEPQRR